MAWDNTDQNGSYRLVLPQGYYRVWARPAINGQPFLDEYYDDVFGRSQAIPVPVTVSNDTPQIDFTLRHPLYIRGRVVDENSGQPLPGVRVTGDMIPDPDNFYWNWMYHGTTETDLKGEYALLVPPGSNYLVETEFGGTFYFRQCWSNTWYREQATLLTVAEGSTVSNINFAMETGGRISGFVRRQGDLAPIVNCHVYSIDYATGAWTEGRNTDGTGHYSMAVPVGTYRVRACPECSSLAYLPEWYNGTNSQGDGVPVEVTVSQETGGIEFRLWPEPVRILTTNLPPAYLNTPYSVQLEATDGLPPYTWSFTPGWDLQAFGLSLSTNGVISGIPTQGGSREASVRVTDSLAHTATQPLSISVYPTLPTVRLEPRGWARLGTGELQFSLKITGTEGRSVTLQASRDLVVWTDRQTTGDGMVQILDSTAGAPYQFFRTVWLSSSNRGPTLTMP